MQEARSIPKMYIVKLFFFEYMVLSFSMEEYRELLRRYPTGVTVVSSSFGGVDCGATVNSFTSISMDPPLIAVFMAGGSRTLNAIESSGKFIVNFLNGEQEQEAVGFAQNGNDDKFRRFRHSFSDSGIVYLEESIGRIECDLYKSEKIADHIMIIGRVTGCVEHNQNKSMVYYRRKFGSTEL
ncbi:MAG: hypothetical protein B2I17_01780 [Thermoplasmatales archaeon B_DKE]|nr:MAG: hypothetical protein B2I17_03525 [Thermoplasmatales archaeon B_DKE]OWP57389.1 MAG: hypothetical protein B2I17_01780 [Thermoplasmatales archaeon B_DKE]